MSNKKQHSTETLNLLITDHLLDAMDNKKLSAVILFDLSKAFDSISHSILLLLEYPRKQLNGLKAI
jgi:hypothetical protein